MIFNLKNINIVKTIMNVNIAYKETVARLNLSADSIGFLNFSNYFSFKSHIFNIYAIFFLIN